MLGRQLYSGKSKGFMKAYVDALNTRHGYFIVEISHYSEDKYRLRTGIFPVEDNYRLRTRIFPVEDKYRLRTRIFPVEDKYRLRTRIFPVEDPTVYRLT